MRDCRHPFLYLPQEDEILAMRLQMQCDSDYKRENFLREQQLEADGAYALKLDASQFHIIT